MTSPVTNLAEELASQASSGTGAARATVAGDRSIAFSWADSIPWAGSVFGSVLTDGLQYRRTLVTPSATPAKKTPRGGQKPSAVTISSSTEQLPKYSGLGKIATEDLLDTSNLVPAIQAVLFGQCLEALSADVGIALRDAARTATGATWAESILAGIAQLPTASLLVISGGDLAAIVNPSGGWLASQADAQIVLFGLGVLILPGLAAGTAYVATTSALTMFDSRKSPLVLLDPFSNSETNEILIVADVFAAGELTAPGNAVACTVAPVEP